MSCNRHERDYWMSKERAQECRELIRKGGLYPEEEQALIEEVYKIERHVESSTESES